MVRVDRRAHRLSRKEAALLAFFLDHEGEEVNRLDIERVVWPEHVDDPSRFTNAMLSDTVDALRHVIESDSDVVHFEHPRPDTYRFVNHPVPEPPPESA